MNKVLTSYTGFVIACVIVIVLFITANNYTQLAAGILMYPLLVYFSFRLFPQKKKVYNKKPSVSAQVGVNADKIGISDIDKRAFLKLIGATGISLFLFSLFNKKAEGLFFKSVTGPTQGNVTLLDPQGQKVDPARNQPLDGFRISEFEDNIISFYGFTEKDGAWYIMRIDADNGSFRYTAGKENFPNYWRKRHNLIYDYFNNVF